MDLKVGMKGTAEKVVDSSNTASTFGSGGVEVFATPVMIGLMEEAACNAVHPHMQQGLSTVGTEVNIKHFAATPVGMRVRAEAELVQVDVKRLLFKVAAYDDKELIGEGTHERYIIDYERFMKKAEAKKAQ